MSRIAFLFGLTQVYVLHMLRALGVLMAVGLTAPQTGYRYGGTFIGAIICADGIVVASDSRMTFMDAADHAFGYLDGMPKIYVDRGAAVAMSGLTNLEGELFSSFARRNDYLLSRPVNEVLFGFLVWLPFKNNTSVGLISAGFLDGEPMICSKSPMLAQRCSNSGYIASKDSPLLRETLTKLGRIPNTNEGAVALRAAIGQYSKTDTTVGGPTSILKLTHGAPPQWLENPPTDRGLSQVCELVQEHRNGRLRIMPLGDPQELERRLAASCPK